MLQIQENISNEIVIKNSRFICFLYNVSTIDDVNNTLEKIRKDYKDATHICYAYRLEKVQKYSDDGEPGGTAGAPIVNVLEKNNITNILAIVVRYFGGIKLGAGGLVRAYSKSVMEAVGEAEIVEIEEYKVYEITFEYCDIKLVDTEIRNNNLNTIDKVYSDKVIYFTISRENKDISKIFEKYHEKINVNYKNNQFLEKI